MLRKFCVDKSRFDGVFNYIKGQLDHHKSSKSVDKELASL